MDILQTFLLDGTAHSIDARVKDGEPIFNAAHLGRVIGLTNIRVGLARMNACYYTMETVDTPGGCQKAIYLTEIGAYRLIMRSRKPIAEPFCAWVGDVIRTIRKTGVYDIRQEASRTIAEAVEQLAAKCKIQARQATHAALMQAFTNRKVFYLGDISDDGVHFIIKAGSTFEPQTRGGLLVADFGSFHFFRMLECDQYRKFEKFMHAHPDVKPHAYHEPINGRQHGEVYRVTAAQRAKIVDIATRNVHKFRTQPGPAFRKDRRHDELVRELADVKALLAGMHVSHQATAASSSSASSSASSSTAAPAAATPPPDEPVTAAPAPSPPADVTATQLPDAGPDAGASSGPGPHAAPSSGPSATRRAVPTYARSYTQAKGPKIQRYSADGKTLLATYTGFPDAELDSALAPRASGFGIRAAVANRRLHREHRWAWLRRSLPDSTVQDIGETDRSVAEMKTGLVAMLNLERTIIVKVYMDQKDASAQRGMKSGSAVNTSLKTGVARSGHHFDPWDKCDPELQREYLERKNSPGLPAPRPNGRATAVERVDSATGAATRFASVHAATRHLRISRGKLFQNIGCGLEMEGARWRLV
jgi:prophage antirepressor-like protein